MQRQKFKPIIIHYRIIFQPSRILIYLPPFALEAILPSPLVFHSIAGLVIGKDSHAQISHDPQKFD